MILINTSNNKKLDELKRLFKTYNIEVKATTIDIQEIDSDPLSVVLHKVSQVNDNILVEDVSLEIENSDIGVNIKWSLDKLESLKGRRAKFIIMLARRQGNEAIVYKGEVSGEIVERKGNNDFGFDAYFKPLGSIKTLAESKEDCYNARAIAVKSYVENNVFYKGTIITNWAGSWQEKKLI